MNRQTLHILVGAAVLLLGTGVILASSGGKGRSAGDGYPLSATFQSIDGVGIGTEVLLAGIRVGKVTARRYEPDGHRATLVMSIDPAVRIPVDSVAMIVSSGLLGGKYLKLEPGGEEEMMQPGDSFEYVQDSIIFEELLEKVVLDAEARRKKRKEHAKDNAGNGAKSTNPFGSLLK